MFPTLLLFIILAYFGLLLGIAFYTSRYSDNESFFIGNRNSTWWVVAFGMIGTSLSGMTFISVPGTVGKGGFEYFQVVIGYILGYFVVAFILLPLYYRLKVISIYSYLQQRFGNIAYKTGAFFFILSRTLGATLRLYLVIKVMEFFVLDQFGISFEVASVIILLLILLYTYRGGVKTIVWTDTLQTTFMLLGLIVCIIYIMNSMHTSLAGTWDMLSLKHMTHTWNMDVKAPGYFLKQIVGGMFITIGMTGLDQEMMQKNISVTNLAGSQKNMITMSLLMGVVVFIFLLLGGLLYLFANTQGGAFINTSTGNSFILNGKSIVGDDIFPFVVFHYLPPVAGIVFIIGLISALFPSADGALTALTSSFCIDILGIRQKKGMTDKQQKRTRLFVHYTFAAIFLMCIFIFKAIDNGSLIQLLLNIAGYTYGPLLALFSFGIFTKRNLRGESVPLICIAGPCLCFVIKQNDKAWLDGYSIGLELLLINALITWILLLLISKKPNHTNVHPSTTNYS